MARKKKEEVKEIVIDYPGKNNKIIIETKTPDFGTGWTGINNRIQYELREDKRNE